MTTLINNAGIQWLLDFTADQPPGPADVAPEIATNLTGLINVTSAALPLLRRAPRARVVHVGSGLGFVPYAKSPVYSAAKAAVHSLPSACDGSSPARPYRSWRSSPRSSPRPFTATCQPPRPWPWGWNASSTRPSEAWTQGRPRGSGLG